MIPALGRIAAVTGAESTTVQALFAALAAEWREAGAKVVGVIGEPHGIPGRDCGAGILRDIVSGKPFPIYLDIPPDDTACHLDATGVVAASTALRDQVLGSDLVLLSKFGKLEALHAGLIGAFETARAAGKPVLTSVSDKHRAAWTAFAPDATLLAADAAALQAWWRTQQPRR
jgi:hypothetical protein